MTPKNPMTEGEALARKFHEAYERLAPSFGYETRAETREFDPDSPNGRLMIAVCALASAQAREEELRAEVAENEGAIRVWRRRCNKAEARAERLEEALREIADWKLPPTGETWPTGGEVSYEALFGSNGARDYIRSVARAALSTNAATQTGETT